MPQTITVPMFGHFVVAPDNRLEVADLTATSSVLTFAQPCKWFFCSINMKSFTSGTGTVGPIFILEVADDSGFTTNIRRIAEEQVTVREANHCLFLIGASPDGAKGFARTRLILSGTDACTYDAVVYGAP